MRTSLRKRTPGAQAGVTFASFGVNIRLELSDSTLREAVERILPPGWQPIRAGRSAAHFGLDRIGPEAYRVTVAQDVWFEGAGLDMALGTLDAQMRLFIATNAPGHVFVHAGVVAADGRALVLPGESFSGKSTLVKALIDAGATYYSDEYAVLDEHGRVHPYPRPVSIRASASVEEHDVGDSGGAVGDSASELAVVAITRYRPGGEWRPRTLSSGQGTTALLANTVPARARPRSSLRAVARAVGGALVIESERGEAAAVAPELLAHLAAR